jgi:hypothetical protein
MMGRLDLRRAVVLVLACAAAASAQPRQPSSPAEERALADARAAAAGLTMEIRGLLLAEMQKGGPAAAVTACASHAQVKTAEFRNRTGSDIRRVSLRHRNAANAPDEWERAGLESFDRLSVDARPDAERWEVVREDGRASLRYLKPVVTSAMCLACHGASAAIPEPVRRALETADPGDRATGFAAGDVRGAISVRVPLAPPPQ